MSTQTVPNTYPLDRAFEEKIYAGVLGKLIGVYLGRPFEGWDNARIERELGDITDYVHERLGTRLIVTDDDIAGTFTFLRAFEDQGLDYDLTAEDIGNSWLNYLIEGHSVLWWGGMGNSTEHTAYLRLKAGIPAPRSGSMALNGQVVAEQIGAQIFIDGWAMLCPGDPEAAAALARRAGSVSHDGEALHGAMALAAAEAQAVVTPDANSQLDAAVGVIPRDSLIRRLIDDVRDWHARNPDDWRTTMREIQARYGYDKYGGNCHMVPNHALIVMGLLHADGDFAKAMQVVNTAGWDTDCNSGNLGCLMGISVGLAGLTPHLREPVADRCYLPTADGGRAISDAWTESQRIISFVRGARGEPTTLPAEAAIDFAMPGAVQGFQAEAGSLRHTAEDGGALLLSAAQGESALALRDVFVDSLATSRFFHRGGYALVATPQLNPGQRLRAQVSAAQAKTSAQLAIRVFDENDDTRLLLGPATEIDAGSTLALTWEVPDLGGYPIAQVGVRTGAGEARLHELSWDGAPRVTLTRPDRSSVMWQRAWVSSLDTLWHIAEPFRLMQNEGTGLLSYGCRSWRAYRVSADVTPHLADRAGLVARYQGLRRYYALLLNAQAQKLQLVREYEGTTVLAECEASVEFGRTYRFELQVDGDKLRGSVNDQVLHARDGALADGGVALLIDTGRSATQALSIAPLA
ncbi:MAG: ADP-ribosylglycohydrolase family protein [Pseudomonadota bacterium]